jgi:hypothetical protein
MPALLQRIPDPTTLLSGTLAQRRAPSDRRSREPGQQLVASTIVSIRRSIRADPLPCLAQRPQHAIADPLYQQLHIGIGHFRLRVELRLPTARLPAVACAATWPTCWSTAQPTQRQTGRPNRHVTQVRLDVCRDLIVPSSATG